MLRYSMFIVVSVFLFSCATPKVETPTPPKVEPPKVEPKEDRNIVWLDDLEESTLTAKEQAMNQSIIAQFKEKKKLLAKIKKEDTAEKTLLESKKQDLEKHKKEFESLLRDKGLSQELQDQIAQAQTEEQIRELLKDSGLTEAEIQEIIDAKKKIIAQDKNLRLEALAKIYKRLIRNRELGIETVFCSQAGSIDMFVLSPVFYDTNNYKIEKEASEKLYMEVNLISGALPQYPDLLLQINGNTDERGTDNYNKNLGDFRWTSGADLLEFLAFEKDIRGVSRGEECPLEQEKDESQESWWGKNRRADFVWELQDKEST